MSSLDVDIASDDLDNQPIEDEAEIDINLRTDPRAQWIKERILAYVATDDEDLFYDMFEDPAIKQSLARFIAAPLQPNDLSLTKRTFYVNKIIVDKLIHEDKEYTEWRIVPPPVVAVPQKKGKKKKGKKDAEPEPEAEQDDQKAKGKGAKGMKGGKGAKGAKIVKDSEPEEDEDVETVAAAVTDVSDVDETKKSLVNLATEEPAPAAAEDHYFPPPQPSHTKGRLNAQFTTVRELLIKGRDIDVTGRRQMLVHLTLLLKIWIQI
ncbi:uncharacterized protein [Maniola hyperantus]|uniref:uncharacterized protein n=1 Tax=Aphantopus hyperantus TaxID=2795564 RepID=UPI00374A28B6